jgi:Mg2+/Co2+ transporter CorB
MDSIYGIRRNVHFINNMAEISHSVKKEDPIEEVQPTFLDTDDSTGTKQQAREQSETSYLQRLRAQVDQIEDKVEIQLESPEATSQKALMKQYQTLGEQIRKNLK